MSNITITIFPTFVCRLFIIDNNTYNGKIRSLFFANNFSNKIKYYEIYTYCDDSGGYHGIA